MATSDSKYVVLLAEKIVKPLMKGFLTGELEIQNYDASKDSSNKEFKCNFCDKICKTTRGLKGHITKMHLNEGDNSKDVESLTNKRKSMEDVNEVVEEILDSVRDKTLKGHIIDIKRSKIGIRESRTGFIGYISKRSLPMDDYVMYRDNLVIKGVSSGLRFEIGKEIAIKIDKIDMISQEVLFMPLYKN